MFYNVNTLSSVQTFDHVLRETGLETSRLDLVAVCVFACVCLLFSLFLLDEGEEEDEVDDVVSRLAEIADEIPFAPPEIEEDSSGEFPPWTLTCDCRMLSCLCHITVVSLCLGGSLTLPSCYLDGTPEDVEKLIGLILRESGDRLNEQVRNIKPLHKPGCLSFPVLAAFTVKHTHISPYLARLQFTDT